MEVSEKVKMFMKKGILVSPDLVQDIDVSLIEQIEDQGEFEVWNKEHLSKFKETYTRKSKISDVKILYNYDKESRKRTFQDFVAYFNNRYNSLSKILKGRTELDRLTSIQRIMQKKDREKVSVIGMVNEKKETKNGNIILQIEDPTGRISVLVSKEKEDIFKEARDIVLDEVIGITGTSGNGIIFSDVIIFPDIPVKEPKNCPEEIYSIFISDVEIGSVNFMKEEFERFIEWLNGKFGGSEQSKIASKVKYLFIVGDLVAGVGVYPGQEEELLIPDIKQQYDIFAEYIKRIPENIHIIMCAGNHDAGRITEPQPPLYKDFGASVLDLPNVTFVSNPSLIRIEEREDFVGFDVLLYHGFSLPYFADNVESIRAAGGQERADLIMEFYLKRRHLAPTHTSNMYIPDSEHDPMVIENVPDILATGHIHRTSVGKYRGVTLLNCSAWTSATDYQLKRGLIPQPGRALLFNLKNNKVNVLKFTKDKKGEENEMQ